MNMTCVKVNSMIWMVRSGVGIGGSFCSNGAPCMYTISGLNFARHSHLVMWCMQLNIHGGVVLCYGLLC